MTEVPFRAESTATPGEALLEYELPRDGSVRVTVRAGERRTGGHTITVTRITRSGPQLTIECAIGEPPAGAIVTQVLTSPAQTVSIPEALVRGIRHAVLLDQSGAELARVSRISA